MKNVRAFLNPGPAAWGLAVAAIVLGLVRTTTAAERDVEAEVGKLVEDLGDANVPRRYQAAKRLAEIGRPAMGPLRKAAADHPSEDVRQRAAVVAQEIEKLSFTVVREFTGLAGEDWRRWATRVVVTPDGRRVLAGNGNGQILWDVETGKTIRTFGEPGQSTWSLAVSRDGKRAICGGGNDRTARVWDLETGKEIQKLVGHTKEVWGVALTADGKRAVTGGWDSTIRVWDLKTGQQERSFEGVADKVRAIALSPDERYLAAAHFNVDRQPGTLRLWDFTQGKLIRSYEDQPRPVTSVSFSRDGKTVITSCHDGTVRFWATDSDKELKRFTTERAYTEAAALSDDGSTFIACGTEPDAAVRLWDVATGMTIYASDPAADGFLAAAMLPDGRSAVVAGRDGIVRLWRWK